MAASKDRRRKWKASGEYVPEKVLMWKRYADPINQALMDKYRDTTTIDNSLIIEEKPEEEIERTYVGWRDL